MAGDPFRHACHTPAFRAELVHWGMSALLHNWVSGWSPAGVCSRQCQQAAHSWVIDACPSGTVYVFPEGLDGLGRSPASQSTIAQGCSYSRGQSTACHIRAGQGRVAGSSVAWASAHKRVARQRTAPSHGRSTLRNAATLRLALSMADCADHHVMPDRPQPVNIHLVEADRAGTRQMSNQPLADLGQWRRAVLGRSHR